MNRIAHLQISSIHIHSTIKITGPQMVPIRKLSLWPQMIPKLDCRWSDPFKWHRIKLGLGWIPWKVFECIFIFNYPKWRKDNRLRHKDNNVSFCFFANGKQHNAQELDMITRDCDQLQFYLFADDTNLLFAHQNLKTLEFIVHDELSRVYNWLSLNIKKIELCYFST